MTPRRAGLVALGVLGTMLIGIAIHQHEQAFPSDRLLLILRAVGIVSFLIAGIVATDRHPESRTGPLMIGTAFGFVAIEMQAYPSAVLRYIGVWLGGLPHLLLAHLILTYPTGRFSSRIDRLAISAAYVLVVGIGFLFNHLPYGLWLLWTGVALTYLVVVLALRRWVRSTGPLRRALRPVPFASLVLAGLGFNNGLAAFFLTTGTNMQTWSEPASFVLAFATPLVPFAFLYGFARTRRARGALGELVVRMDSLPEPDDLREALAKALRDPSIEIGYWSRDVQAYVDAEGHPVHLPENADPERAHTPIVHAGEPVAAIVHDIALVEEREVVEAAVAAARLALVNERLQAEVRAQLAETQASRARIVEAADAERRRLERDLHDGAQQRLVSVSLALRMLQRRATSVDEDISVDLGRAADDLREAIDELRDLAQGIHPPILTEEGLAPALETLAERAPFPVQVVGATDERLPDTIEATVYFIASEALTNAAKHSGATKAEVHLTRDRGWLHVEVTDNGTGGADATAGSGLVGLADRVAAAFGTLEMRSPPGGGTVLSARLPCE